MKPIRWLGGITESMRTVLLEPYRSALILRAVDEGLLRPDPIDGPGITLRRNTIGQRTIDDALRLAVLSDELAMMWVDPRELPPEAKRLDHIYESGLGNTGIVEYIRIPEELVGCGKGLTRIEAVWEREADLVKSYERLILSQLQAKGYRLHWSILRLLRAVRTQDRIAISLLEPCIPKQDRPLAHDIIRGRSHIGIDLTIINAAHEIKLAVEHATSMGCKLAGIPPEGVEMPSDESNAAESVLQVWRVCIDVLLGERMSFPIVSTLAEAQQLRRSPEIAEFRFALRSFADELSDGSVTSLAKLRKQVLSSARAFRRFPKVGKFGNFATYVSFASGLAESIAGFFGPSIGLGILALGASGLAKSLEKKGKWLYVTKQDLDPKITTATVKVSRSG